MLSNANVISLTTLATVFVVSVSSAGQFDVTPAPADLTQSVSITGKNTKITIDKQSIDYNPEINEKKDMILKELYLEKQEYADEVSTASFDKAENYIKSLQVPFLVSPIAFIRPTGHVAFYWGLGGSKHIMLSVIDDDLLLSIISPEEDIKIVRSSNMMNFDSLARIVNDYLG